MSVEQTPGTDGRTGSAPAIDDSFDVGKQLLGRYRISRTISHSDISLVRLAIDLRDGKTVAIKTLTSPEPEAIKIFSKDVQLMSTVCHANLVPFIEYQEPFYVMKFVSGVTLDKLLSKLKGLGKVGDVSRIFQQLVDPMLVAHEHQIIHGQLNPRNVLFEKVDDHASVRLVGFCESGVRQLIARNDSSNMPFVSPEDRAEYCPTTQSDVYSLGAIAYLSLTGKTPPLNIEESMQEFVSSFTSSVSKALDNPRYLAVLVYKSMSADTSERYPDLQCFKRDLEKWKQSIGKARTITQNNPLPDSVSTVAKATSEEPASKDIETAPPVAPASDVGVATQEPLVVLAAQNEEIEEIPPVIPSQDNDKTEQAQSVLPATDSEVAAPSEKVEQESASETATESLALGETPAAGSIADNETIEKKSSKEVVAEKLVLEGAPSVESVGDNETGGKTVAEPIIENQAVVRAPVVESLALKEKIDQGSIVTRLKVDPASLVGEILTDRYVILELCSDRGLSVVYLATDLTTDEPVAIKTVRNSSPETVLAFSQEIDEIKSVTHPNIVRFLDYQKIENHPFYIAEFVEGPTISELLESIGRVETEEQIADAIMQICEVVGYLQEKKLYYGNLNPESVLLCESEGAVLVKLAGFGTGKLRSLLQQQDPSNADFRSYANFQHYKQVSASNQAAIYEVGAIAFEMVTGRKPFETYAMDDLSLSIGDISVEKLSLLRPDIFMVDELNSLLGRALTPSLNQEYKSVAELKAAVESWIQSTRADLESSLSENSDKTTGSQTRPWHSLKSLRDGDAHDELSEQKLKSAQIAGEKTLGMLFTKIVSVKGRRESPLYTIFQLVFLSTAAVLSIFATVRYVQENHETIRAQYLTLAQQVSNQIPSGRKRSKNALSSDLSNQHFSYSEDPAYKRWCNNKLVGSARRIEPSGDLIEK